MGKRRYADLAGSFATLVFGVAIVAMMLLALASSATADGCGDDSDALVTTNALTGTAVGTTTFAAVFVVASTFSFAVARRRREFALLRSIGATPRQVRRIVMREALAVSVPAGVLGCVLGRAAAGPFVDWLGNAGLAPEWLTLRDAMWPLYTAFAVGVAVALAGASVAARQASGVRPVEALRQASLDSAGGSRVRIWIGALVLAAAFGFLLWTAVVTPGEAVHRKHRTLAPMLIVPGVALLAPVLVGPPLRALGRLVGRREPVALELARCGAASTPRRTAATVAPVLMAVALATGLLGGTDSAEDAGARDAADRLNAELVVTARDGALDPQAVDDLRTVPGTAVAAPVPTDIKLLAPGDVWINAKAWTLDPRDLARTMNLPLVGGQLEALADDTVVVTDDWARPDVGGMLAVRLPDGARHELRITATVKEGMGGTPLLLTSRHAPAGGRAFAAFVDLPEEPAAAAAAEQAVREAAARHGVTVQTKKEWARGGQGPEVEERRRNAVYVVLGIVLLYAAFAIANTAAASAADQAPAWRALRLAGATRAQVLRTAALESVLMVALGLLLAGVAAAATLGPLWLALLLLVGPIGLTVPWGAIALIAAACAAVAVPAGVAAASVTLRRSAGEMSAATRG
ncbi:FtsX-like permease family protein [Yinghuangia soli]|uniref:FtsX-like permease family protein n=1 Tax=Yinghuangia soli TaxID=2908204 RepID=A0AA41PZ99_9ACTN|nr:FtsX-like permease family protein [Yinghuangia soli]MCF2528337.1 FtsX-like permease family protein [Yinghuangia soli]